MEISKPSLNKMLHAPLKRGKQDIHPDSNMVEAIGMIYRIYVALFFSSIILNLEVKGPENKTFTLNGGKSEGR